jgi:hypothetical protein
VNTALSPKTHRFTPRFQRKRYVSLHVFSKSATIHSAYSPKTHNFASSLNTLYTAKSAQFYSAFSPTMISLTPRFRKNAQNDPKTHSYKDSAKFNSAFSATTLSHASRFRQKRQVIENFEYLCEFKEYFRK